MEKEAEVLTQEQIQKDNIRAIREGECFAIVNRGKFWYDKLATKQMTELKSWYNEWLDAPQTLKVPKKPTWIK